MQINKQFDKIGAEFNKVNLQLKMRATMPLSDGGDYEEVPPKASPRGGPTGKSNLALPISSGRKDSSKPADSDRSARFGASNGIDPDFFLREMERTRNEYRKLTNDLQSQVN